VRHLSGVSLALRITSLTKDDFAASLDGYEGRDVAIDFASSRAVDSDGRFPVVQITGNLWAASCRLRIGPDTMHFSAPQLIKDEKWQLQKIFLPGTSVQLRGLTTRSPTSPTYPLVTF
jgi:hypothetical protein